MLFENFAINIIMQIIKYLLPFCKQKCLDIYFCELIVSDRNGDINFCEFMKKCEVKNSQITCSTLLGEIFAGRNFRWFRPNPQN